MRRKQPSLRGSVNQSSGTVRMRSRETTRLTILIRLAIASGALLIVTFLFVWGWQSGWIPKQFASLGDDGLHLTQKAHFSVRKLVVEGRDHTDRDQLSAAIEAPTGSPMFGFDPHQAEARIAKLPWIEDVTVERRLPDIIYVHLTERVPLARWQHDNRTAVIDRDGKVLGDADPEQFTQLPLVVGSGAPAEAQSLLDLLHTFPQVDHVTAAAVLVSERRWDLHLQPKIIARLPETDVADALKRLSVLISEQKILERDIVAIDLRQPDRLILEPGSAQPQHPTDNRL